MDLGKKYFDALVKVLNGFIEKEEYSCNFKKISKNIDMGNLNQKSRNNFIWRNLKKLEEKGLIEKRNKNYYLPQEKMILNYD